MVLLAFCACRCPRVPRWPTSGTRCATIDSMPEIVSIDCWWRNRCRRCAQMDGRPPTHISSHPFFPFCQYCLGASVSFHVVPGTAASCLGRTAILWVCTIRILSRATGRFVQATARPCESRARICVSASYERMASDVAYVRLHHVFRFVRGWYVWCFECLKKHVPCSWVVRKT